MGTDTLAAALEREHREIDSGIEAFLAASAGDAERRAALSGAMEALRRHIYLEEEFIFPPLRDAGLMAPIFVMLREHGELWRTMEEIDASGADAAAPELCRRLLEQLEAHNSKEEPIIYPQMDSELTPIAVAAVQDLLESGATPEGWVCTSAHR